MATAQGSLSVNANGVIEGHLPCGHSVRWIQGAAGVKHSNPTCAKCEDIFRANNPPVPLTVGPGGTLKGMLPCGHDTSHIDLHDGKAYCLVCWNA